MGSQVDCIMLSVKHEEYEAYTLKEIQRIGAREPHPNRCKGSPQKNRDYEPLLLQETIIKIFGFEKEAVFMVKWMFCRFYYLNILLFC
jgi:hypothetical protein